jgi:TonB family protein
LALLLSCLALAAVPAAHAQSEKPARKVIRTERPEYPLIVKTAKIGGTVRLNARVLANGTVAKVEIVGGNPILADSATKAVMRWKYAPAASPSNEIVIFDFKPN